MYSITLFVVVAICSYQQVSCQERPLADHLKDATVIMFSTPTCPGCKATEDFLNSKNIKFSKVEIASQQTNLWKELTGKTGKQQVPQVFINGEFVGGQSELQQLDSSGELMKKVNKQ